MAQAVFASIALLFIIADIIVIALAISQRSRAGYLLAATMTAAALVDLGYTASVTSPDYFAMSLSCSVYFCGVTLSLFFLLLYLFDFIGVLNRKSTRGLLVVLGLFVVADLCSLMSNPFTEVALTYSYDANAISHWKYVHYFLFDYHLFLSYVMVGIAVGSMVVKCIRVPGVYRAPYVAVLSGLLFIVFVNAGFLLIPAGLTLDYSLIFYSVMGIYLYVSRFHSMRNLTLNATRNMILDELGSAVVLFDQQGEFVTCNRYARTYLDDLLEAGAHHFDELAEIFDLEDRITDPEADYLFVESMNFRGEVFPVRFNLRVLRDHKGRVLGRLIIVADNSAEVDLVSGFNTKSRFEKDFISESPIEIEYPVRICICDLNHLADLNTAMGYDVGNEAIGVLANLMRECLPEKAYFARYDEANLLAVCPGMDASSMDKALTTLRSRLRQTEMAGVVLDMQSASSKAIDNPSDVSYAAFNTLSALRVRKMLDFDSAHSSLLSSLAMALRQTDTETEEHVIRTRTLAEYLGRRLNLSDWEQGSLALLCLLHDIGKIGIPLEILNKPGKLTDAEWELLKTHALKGYEIAAASVELEGIADCILHHHECWDGSGYPDGLMRESIPLLSRIVAVVDAFDAMTNDRPYRPAIPWEAAFSELRRCAGVQFDPAIVAEFLDMMNEENFIEMDGFREGVVPASQDFTSMVRLATEFEEGGFDQEPFMRPRLHAYGDADEPRPLNKVRYAKYILDDSQNLLTVMGDFEDMTGFSQQDVRDYKLSQNDLLFPEDREGYWIETIRQLEAAHEAFIEHRIRRKDGGSLMVLCYGRQYYDSAEHASKSAIVIADIGSTSVLRMERDKTRSSALRGLKRWEDKARRDVVTGLLNREAFRADVQMRMLDMDKVVVMAMLDVDFFKKYNDSYGHPEGDLLLRRMADALTESVGDDGFACRMGGDEFAVAFLFEDDTASEVITQRVNKLWETTLAAIRERGRDVTVSLGVARVAKNRQSFVNLYNEADRCLYQAKHEGRNCLRCNWE